MTSSWRRAFSTFALASQLLFGTPEASAKPPISPPVTLQPAAPAEDTSDSLDGKVVDPRDFPLYFNWNLFYLSPSALPTPKNSILSLADMEDLAVSTLGLSVDCFIGSKDLSQGWYGTLPFGIFVDYSSTQLFRSSIDDTGAVKYNGITAGYRIKGDMNYFALGLTFGPSVLYQNGPFSIGLSIDIKGGLTFLASENKIDIGLTDKVIRAFAEEQGIEPDAHGSIKIYGFGGFGQVLVGPVIGLYDVVCSGGAGLRYDGLTLRVQERVDNPQLMEQLPGNYKSEYGRASLLFGAKCGYRFP